MSRLRFFTLLFYLLFNSIVAQQSDIVDFKSITSYLTINPYQEKVSGKVTVSFYMLKASDSVFLDAKAMKVKPLNEKDSQILISATNSKIWFVHAFKPNKEYSVSFFYEAYPKKAMYFIGWNEPSYVQQVFTQGQGKYTSNWLPSIDNMNDKIIFNTSITFKKGFEVISNGQLSNASTTDSTKTWHYTMKHPMSSYLVALAIGKYKKKVKKTKSGVPILLYYYPKDSLKADYTYKYTTQIFDFLEQEIGIAYPWSNYKQIPVKDFLYAGMENTTATIFSDSYMVDSIGFNDKSYLNVNAHELAHQWFGNLITEVSAEHHWLHEGFATYYALLAEREIFGEDYYYTTLLQYANNLLDFEQQQTPESLLNPKASSLTFYQKGALAFHVLRELVGDEGFKKAVSSFLKEYAFKNVTVANFLQHVQKVTHVNLQAFRTSWLEQTKLPKEELFKSLQKNKVVANILLLNKIGVTDFWNNLNQLAKKELFSNASYVPLLQTIAARLDSLPKQIQTQIIKKGLESKTLKTRQTIAVAANTFFKEHKPLLEALLTDASYTTQENALFNLWYFFPEDRFIYLNQTQHTIGLPNKNVRLLWLTLALITPDYNTHKKQAYFKELSEYTSSYYHFEVRELAFNYLYKLNAFTDTNLKDLLQACEHWVWQFSKSSKQMLATLLQDEEYLNRYKNIFSELSVSQQNILKQYFN